MNYILIAKDPLESNFPTLVFPYSGPAAAKQLLQRLTKHYGKTITYLLQNESWEVQGSRPLQLTLADAEAAQGVRSIRLMPLASLPSQHENWRVLGGDIAKAALKLDKTLISLQGLTAGEQEAAAKGIIEGYSLASYNFSAYKSKNPKKSSGSKNARALQFATSIKKPKELNQSLLQSTIDAQNWARDLVHTPAADLQAHTFIKSLKKRLGKNTRVVLRTHTEAQLRRLGAGGILGVAQGSDTPPVLAHLIYKPRANGNKSNKQRRIVLIGKGVTFDSGGLSLKTAGGMVDMKCDMAGAAAVASVFTALAALPAKMQPAIEVHGLIPLVENMVSGNAMRPGDVLKTISGKTIEVVNTDAEGRLILADALEYAAKLKPTAIIDIATLTGACLSALGESYAGIFCEDTTLLKDLLACADETGELLWPLPFGDRFYRSLLDSPIADLKNSAGTHPGATLAALFLKEFAPASIPWAHLDIAGPAYLSRDSAYLKKGATGFGVRLLLNYLQRAASN